MTNKKVTMPSAKIREIARVALEGHWKQIALFMFLYYLMTTGVSGLLDLIFYSHQTIPLGGTGEVLDGYVYFGSQIYTWIISGPLSWALSKFMLDFFRYQKIEYTTLLEGFSLFARVLLLYMVYLIRVALWSLLLVVPGIIASFRYSQAFYVMIDHPEYTASQCLAESSRIMEGNKMKYFCLDLSFIGWTILATTPVVFYEMIGSETTGIAAVLVSMILSIPAYFLSSYTNMAYTVFYELATDNLTVIDRSEDASNTTYTE